MMLRQREDELVGRLAPCAAQTPAELTGTGFEDTCKVSAGRRSQSWGYSAQPSGTAVVLLSTPHPHESAGNIALTAHEALALSDALRMVAAHVVRVSAEDDQRLLAHDKRSPS